MAGAKPSLKQERFTRLYGEIDWGKAIVNVEGFDIEMNFVINFAFRRNIKTHQAAQEHRDDLIAAWMRFKNGRRW